MTKLPLREFIYECLKKKEFVIKPGARELTGQLKRIGNNLNQIARQVNAGRITDCRRELSAIRQELMDIHQEWQ